MISGKILPLREHASALFRVGVERVGASRAIADVLSMHEDMLLVQGDAILLSGRRIFFVGVGKCATKSALVIEHLLGDRLHTGIVVDAESSQKCELSKIKCLYGTHPFPSETNVSATKEIIDMLSQTNENDLVIFLISGGGSTLLCQPGQEETCHKESMVVTELMRQGAGIQDINTVRKHLSFARGGWLARRAYPAEVISLIFSDVPGDDISFIASGPTVRDTTTVEDAKEILTRYGIFEKNDIVPADLIETPKERVHFARVRNILTVTNAMALEAMAEEAEKRGFSSQIMESAFIGEACEVGAGVARDICEAQAGTALFYGGETTVTVRGNGKGGRNQEVALGALAHMCEGTMVLAVASDGFDNSDIAGGFADEETKRIAGEKSLAPERFLRENDTYHFFINTNATFRTGATGVNVADFIIALKAR